MSSRRSVVIIMLAVCLYSNFLITIPKLLITFLTNWYSLAHENLMTLIGYSTDPSLGNLPSIITAWMNNGKFFK